MSVEYKRIKNRRNTAAGWTQSNPILLEGELGIELDTSKFKFGDGTTHWNDLPYASADEEEIQEIIESISYTKAEVNTIINTVEGIIPTSTSQLTNDAGFITNADIPTDISAFNNDAGYITASEIPAQVQSDWTEVNTTAGSYIQHKPSLATVATTGSYNDLTDKPTIPGQVQSDWTESDTSSSAYIQHKPSLATVATSGSYTDLTNKPTIPTDTSDLTNGAGYITQADVKSYKAFPQGWHITGTLSNLISDINNDSTAVTGMSYMATVSFSDLPANLHQAEIKVDIMDEMQGLGKNILFTVTSSDTSPYHWEYTSAYGAAGTWREWMPNVTLATVATSGSYTDLTDKPSIPTKTSDLTNDSGYITLNQVPGQVNSDWNAASGVAEILNKPNLATVATTGSYTDLSNTPSIPAAQVNSDWNAASGVAEILNKPTIPTLTSQLTNDSGYITSSEIPAQVQSNWTETNTTAGSYIQNKPNLATVATSGDYTDLSNTPSIPTSTSQLTNDAGFITLNEVPGQMQADWTEANSTLGSYIQHKPTIYNEWFGTQQEYDAIVIKDADTIYHIEGGATVTWNEVIGKPTFATVATTGSYNDLTDKPTIPGQVQADWTETNTTAGSYIQHKPSLATVATSGDYTDLSNTPSLATVATSGSYTDLSNTPTIPTDTSDLTNGAGFITINDVPAQAQADWTEADTSDPSYIQNKPSLATVATSGDYNDLTNTPSIPAAQVNSDWNAASGVAQILNKPTIPAAQVNSDWNSDNGVSKILNKPRMGIETLTFTLSDQSTVSIDVWVRTPNYFYVEDISGNNNTLSIKKSNANAPTIEVFKSTDMKNWTSMGNTDTTAITATIPANSKLYLKATANQWNNGSYYNTISASGNHNVGGNIMSLLVGDNYEGVTTLNTNYSYQFYNLFKNNSSRLKSAANLELPATTLTNSCYYSMFENCYGLTTAPAILPATTLAERCYYSMFRDCTSLTTAPELPATTLAERCYTYMFDGCSSLTTAPELPATTLVNWCYSGMFRNCYRLTTAPTLPATTLAQYGCYENMFYGCTLLNKVVTYANTLGYSSTNTWLQNVAATGDFYNLGTATYSSGASGIPSGWTEHTSL